MIRRRRKADDRDMLAAELALGLLDGEARDQAEQRLASEPDFRAEYEGWLSRATDWACELAPVSPGPGLLDRIESELDAVRLPQSQQRSVNGMYRWWAMGSSLAAVVLAGVALLQFQERSELERENRQLARTVDLASGQQKVAQITSGGTVLLSVVYQENTGEMAVRYEQETGGNLAPELWVVPENGAPQSLGQFQGQTVTLKVNERLRQLLIDGATIAITLEPVDGKKHEAPTGTILGTTRMSTI